MGYNFVADNKDLSSFI